MTGDFAGSTTVWDVASGRKVATMTAPGHPGILGVAFSADGAWVAAGGNDGLIHRWKLR
jgi:WD40 repeat protein